MIDLPTGRTGRLLALAIPAVVLAILFLGVVVPLWDLYDERGAVLLTDRQLEPRLRAVAAQVPQLQARVAELRQAAGTRQNTLEGATDAVASAALQSRIEGLAAASGAVIISTDSLPAEPQGGYHRIGLKVAISGTYESIVKLLNSIETANLPLVLDNLQIHAKLQAAATSSAGPLDAAFVVYGFRSQEPPTVTKR